MNRRGFLKLAAAATALSAGGIALIETPKTFFLPPRGGWWAPTFEMRECEQYLINLDAMAYRWDAAWLDSNGEKQQFNVLGAPQDANRETFLFLRHQREQAYLALDRMRRRHGLTQEVRLPLPSGAYRAGYVMYA